MSDKKGLVGECLKKNCETAHKLVNKKEYETKLETWNNDLSAAGSACVMRSYPRGI